MYIVREVMNCKPGKVRPMVEKFRALGDVMEKLGFGRPRVMTDVSGEPYWTVIAEMEVERLSDFFEMDDKVFADAGAAEIMAGYHDLVDHGRREIYKVES
ncbi:MAG TPA: hypothetical protein VI942_06020 [Thermoanaerobaculia bacterium]|nr:hypothetical protein [Thermoanaerobaculia bacterium]